MRGWVLFTLLAFLPGGAAAHPLAPVAFSVDQHGDEVIATVKRARVQPRGAMFSPRFPSVCDVVAPMTVTEHSAFVIEHYRLRCRGSLVGTEFGMDGLSEAGVNAVVRVTLEETPLPQVLLDRTEDVYVVPARATAWDVATTFVRSGLGHLLGGLDHVLFVLGLVLLLRRPRRVLIALTAFTGGHALSMCAAALGWIAFPSVVAEVAIAATLVWLAHQIVVSRHRSEEITRPYLACMGVGVVHGLGFAAAFSEAGINGADLPLALGAFHLGIEVGQIAVVVAALIAMRALTGAREGLEHVAAYAIGSLAFMWLIERAVLIGS